MISDSIKVNVIYKLSLSSIDYLPDKEGDFNLEVLKSQVFSAILSSGLDISEVQDDDITLIDYCGRKITNYDDISHLCEESSQITSLNVPLPDSTMPTTNTSIEESSTPSIAVDTIKLDESVISDPPINAESSNGNNLTIQIWCIASTINFICTSKYICQSTDKESTDSDKSSNMYLQCCHRMVDTTFQLCHVCSNQLDPSLLSTDYNRLSLFSCDSSQLIEMGILSDTISNSVDIDYPVQLYLCRQFFEIALDRQRINGTGHRQAKQYEFQQIIDSGMSTVREFEDIAQQRIARSVIRFDKIFEYSEAFKQSKPHSVASDVAFLHGLLRHFKCDMFSWTNKPPCDNPYCLVNQSNPTPLNQQMTALGMTPPLEDERRDGWAGRCELYKCEHCQKLVRFPRYNNPSYLLSKSPRGRCGEFANAFGLICRSLGLDVFYVRDLTDHVWIEIFVPSLGRFVHADCCERELDSPLLYEAGWGKKLTYIISFSRYGVVESSSKYTRDLNEVIIRRQEMGFGEAFVQQTIREKDKQVEAAFINSDAFKSKIIFDGVNGSSGSACFASERYEEVLKGEFGPPMMAFENMTNQELSVDNIRSRKDKLHRELEGMKFLTKKHVKLEEMKGRISGDYAWKAQRGENGPSPQR